jgi:hypothetical protein
VKRVFERSIPGVMSFAQIGRELGISRGLAWLTYRRAISKLRRAKGHTRMLREIARAKEFSEV